MFELIPDQKAPVSDSADARMIRQRAVSIRLTAGALMFVTLIVFTVVITTHQRMSQQAQENVVDRQDKLTEVEAAQPESLQVQPQPEEMQYGQGAPVTVQQEQQTSGQKAQQAAEAARHDINAMEAAKPAGGDTDEQRLEQEKLKSELERQRVEDEWRQAEIEKELRELESDREEKLTREEDQTRVIQEQVEMSEH